MEGCLTCAELKDRHYVSMIHRKLMNYFSNHPCVDCGETQVEVLLFPDNAIWTMISEQMPWPKINAAIQKREVVCANCSQKRIADKVGPWGVPTKRWDLT